MSIVIFGDSHVVAVGAALAKRRRSDPALEQVVAQKLFRFSAAMSPFFRAEADRRITLLDETAVRSLEELVGRSDFSAGDDHRYVVSMAYTTTILIRSTTWTTHRPYRIAAPPRLPSNGNTSAGRRAARQDRQPVSDGVIAQMALDHLHYAVAFLVALKRLGRDVCALEAPPPRADDPAIGSIMTAEGVLEIDRLARSAIRAQLDAEGVATISPPDLVYSDGEARRGFLKPEFHKAGKLDHHHGNAAYGGLMLDAVLAAVPLSAA